MHLFPGLLGGFKVTHGKLVVGGLNTEALGSTCDLDQAVSRLIYGRS